MTIGGWQGVVTWPIESDMAYEDGAAIQAAIDADARVFVAARHGGDALPAGVWVCIVDIGGRVIGRCARRSVVVSRYDPKARGRRVVQPPCAHAMLGGSARGAGTG
jgi:hypothetical protein